MKSKSTLKMYIKEYRKELLLYISFVFIFYLVLFLHDITGSAVNYAILLSSTLFLIVKIIEITKSLKKHYKLKTQLENLPQFIENFPLPETISEQDLQEIIFKLENILTTSSTEWENKEQNAIDFYSTWVHQIKTPISVIKMTLQSEDTEEHRFLLSELFRIEQYVDIVLSYIRLGSDNSDYVFKEQSLDNILKECIRKYAPQFISKKIKLNYQPTDIKVLTDEKWLSFMIEQILSNSIKYTVSGFVTISIADDKVLKISDSGIGIAPEDLPRIFEKGFTGYNGRNDKKATGIGLYLCKETAIKLGHKITAESTIGKGTTISIDLKHNKLEVE